MHLIPNEPMDTMFFGKTIHEIILVFPYALEQIRSHTDIKRTVPLAR